MYGAKNDIISRCAVTQKAILLRISYRSYRRGIAQGLVEDCDVTVYRVYLASLRWKRQITVIYAHPLSMTHAASSRTQKRDESNGRGHCGFESKSELGISAAFQKRVITYRILTIRFFFIHINFLQNVFFSHVNVKYNAVRYKNDKLRAIIHD